MRAWHMYHNRRGAPHKSFAYRLQRMQSSLRNKLYPRDKTAATFALHFYGQRYQLARADYAFWQDAAAGRWEHKTFATLQRYLQPDSVYVDVGAWIGPTVLFAAHRAKQVYAMEPDPAAYERLLINLRLNAIKNVRPLHAALAAANGVVDIGSARGFGKSVTRIGGGAAGEQVKVLAMDLSRFINWWGIAQIDFLKIDVEGAEFALIESLLQMLAQFKPVMHLSLHAPFFAEGERAGLLTKVVQLARQYKFCYDTKLKLIDPAAIISDTQFTQKFGAVVLTDVAW